MRLQPERGMTMITTNCELLVSEPTEYCCDHCGSLMIRVIAAREDDNGTIYVSAYLGCTEARLCGAVIVR